MPNRHQAIIWTNGDPFHWRGNKVIWVNSLRPRWNRCHFAEDIFKCIFSNENVWIVLKISLKFVPKVRDSNIPALVQIMAWRLPGDKPLSEQMMASLLTHICVTRPQWDKRYRKTDILLCGKHGPVDSIQSVPWVNDFYCPCWWSWEGT